MSPAVIPDGLDPEVRRFVQAVNGAYARHTGGRKVSNAEARRIAEEVRAPWRQGGPAMHATTEHNVPVAGASARIRIYDPAPTEPKAAMIYLHGGGWTLFSLDTHDRLMREYAYRASIAVVGVDYPLSPEAKFPLALDQLVEVVGWLRSHGAALGIDPARLAIGGDSAGANLALAAVLKLRDAGLPNATQALLLNYGAFDTRCSDESARRYGGPDYMLTREEMAMFWGNYLRGPGDERDPLACPMHARFEGLPPVFLTIPECDILTEQSQEMAKRMRSTGVDVTARVYAGATHSFLEAMSISHAAGRAIDDASAWLKEALE
ncbi:MAG TPA: alpha/beta hydrolase fold domain-containing protein [Steroidobacteraceae bacterium]|nr:alpha/beta hydrolase fold domain-containing protein [Steroidobacteraceae bacterium]